MFHELGLNWGKNISTKSCRQCSLPEIRMTSKEMHQDEDHNGFKMFWRPHSNPYIYHIVASRRTCYYSGNQKFFFLKSWLLTCPNTFFRDKTFLFLKIESWNFQHLIDLGFCESSQNFSSFGAHVTIWVQIQLLTWGVTNWDVLLLATVVAIL